MPVPSIVQGAGNGLWKTAKIRIGPVSPQPIATEAISTYISISQSQNGDANQFESICLTFHW